MNIQDAFLGAMAEGKTVTRTTVWWHGRLEILPHRGPECCITYRIGEHGREFVAERWEPEAADIIADDWEVVV